MDLIRGLQCAWATLDMTKNKEYADCIAEAIKELEPRLMTREEAMDYLYNSMENRPVVVEMANGVLEWHGPLDIYAFFNKYNVQRRMFLCDNYNVMSTFGFRFWTQWPRAEDRNENKWQEKV